jgi:tight adherence protein B
VISARLRRPGALAAALLAPFLLGLSGLGTAGAAHAAGESGSIDHAQPTTDGVRLLVSAPPGSDPVDLTGVKVQIGGHAVKSEAVAASSSQAIKRVAILAIDTSESMQGARIAEAKRAATTYLASAPANVQIGVLTFDDSVKLLVKPTLDRNAARAAISKLTLTHNTALYDGVLGAIEATGPDGDDAGQRRILVLSDGKDTTQTDLADVLDTISTSGVLVDAVALQQTGTDSQALREMASAGKGKVLDASAPAALSAAFAQEAEVLSRQLVVTADVPKSAHKSSDVSVTMPVGGQDITATAYLPVRLATKTAAVGTVPEPIAAGSLQISQRVVLGGVVAIAVGLLGVIIALWSRKPATNTEDRLNAQMSAYGSSAGETDPAQVQSSGFSGQARGVAERALANNRGLEARLASKLDTAGMSFKPAEWVLLRAGVAVVGAMLGLLIGSSNILLGLIIIVAAIASPPFYLKFKRASRLRAFAGNLPDTLQLMAGSLSAGLSLAQSIDTIVREGGEPIASEFRRVVIETRLGVQLEDSLEGVAERMESRDWEWVVMAIRIQRDVGGNLAELLLQVAETLREREFLRRHVRALSAEGRLSAYILGGLPPVFLLFLVLTKPDYVHPLFSTPIGFILDIGMGVLLSVGVFWMSKVAKVDV